MANNSENFGFDQNALVRSGFSGFPKRSVDLITPCPIVPQNDESRNAFFMSNSLNNHGLRARSCDLGITPFCVTQNEPFIRSSHRILTRYEDLTTTQAIQRYNVGGNDSQKSQAIIGITPTFSLSGQNNAPFMYDTLGIRDGTSHMGSLNDSFNSNMNISKISGNLSRSANKVNRSRSGRQSMKRVRFRFVEWTNEEKRLMDREILKGKFLPIDEIFKRIAKLLQKKSVRDVAMRVLWLIKNEKLDDVWNWVEPSPVGDLRDLTFYLPNNPNDPDFLAVENMLHPQDTSSRY
ncbi:uncharacterized protein LOC141705681 [Apium graveolens]|uniref:uncharacterized protein LOC141705681 n=1 Tax=Apium graveolens TaxID=4045 RepID=UPI003D7A91FF